MHRAQLSFLNLGLLKNRQEHPRWMRFSHSLAKTPSNPIAPKSGIGLTTLKTGRTNGVGLWRIGVHRSEGIGKHGPKTIAAKYPGADQLNAQSPKLTQQPLTEASFETSNMHTLRSRV